jgi:hypothetical protein
MLKALRMNICLIIHPLQILSALAAILAAILWIFASIKKAPAATEFTQFRMEELRGDILKPLRKQSQALAVQSRLNAFAALAAAVAALCQFALTYLPSCSWDGWGGPLA